MGRLPEPIRRSLLQVLSDVATFRPGIDGDALANHHLRLFLQSWVVKPVQSILDWDEGKTDARYLVNRRGLLTIAEAERLQGDPSATAAILDSLRWLTAERARLEKALTVAEGERDALIRQWPTDAPPRCLGGTAAGGVVMQGVDVDRAFGQSAPLHVGEAALRAMADHLKTMLPQGWGFTLLLFDFRTSNASYVSTADRATSIASLRELADRMEARTDGELGSPGVAG